MPMPRAAKLYIGFTILAGLVALAAGSMFWRSDDMTRFICYLLIANLASGLSACEAVHLAKAAYWSGKRTRYDATGTQIIEG